ncbi:hypothetical protein K1719_029716 [Acacia pycnantha]|nr:hypothetical protein K1719_029716 [Acacia pycnantha]
MNQMMEKAGQHDPSGYFLIEDVFYVDTRDPSAIDYTIPIFDWLRNSKEEGQKKWECIITGELKQKQKAIMGEASVPHLPHLTSVDMQKILVCDIGFRLGAGFLYRHQGDCTLILVIRDMRATKVTVDDKWTPENPCYFCDECFSLHIAEDGYFQYAEFHEYDYHH